MTRPTIHAPAFACPHPDTFETFIREAFLKPHAKSEAAREVAALARDTSLSNAVALALESLPRRTSAPLRKALDGYDQWCQTQLAEAVYQSARPFVRSFNGESLRVGGTGGMPGYTYEVTVADADVDFPMMTGHGYVAILVSGNYDNEDDGTSTTFNFEIRVNKDLTVTLGRVSMNIDYAPKEMVRGLKDALER